MTNLQSPGRNLRVPAEGFQKKLIKRGDWRWQKLLHVCVCVFAINPIFILLFSRFLFKSLCESKYLQTICLPAFKTKLPGLFGGKFHLFHQRMWTSFWTFCLVIWYPLVMIVFQSWSWHFAFFMWSIVKPVKIVLFLMWYTYFDSVTTNHGDMILLYSRYTCSQLFLAFRLLLAWHLQTTRTPHGQGLIKSNQWRQVWSRAQGKQQ